MKHLPISPGGSSERSETSKSPLRFSLGVLLRWLIPTAALAGLVLGWFAYQNQEQDVFDADFNRTADLQSLVSSEDSFLWVEEDSAL